MRAGSIVGEKYRLSREIGQGSMGSVWAAVHMLLDREVAIKFLNPSLEDARTAAARFVAEAKAAAMVKHRFVVDVFDFGITDSGVSYMVQELLQGEPLSELMCEGPAWSLRDAARFMMDCLTGLHAVHERGIIHRDLKPENIYVLRDGEEAHPKLLDFGISKSAESSRDRRVPRPSLRTSGRSRLTAVGSTLGTPAYMSPEQLRNLQSLDARADLYSLGVVFYEWLVGHCPFATTMNFAVLVDRIEAREMAPLFELRPDVGAPLASVIARAIEPDRARRFSSALEMRAALAEVLGQLPAAQTKTQNELPAYVPKGLPPPAITYRPRPAISEGVISLRPAGLRKSPSRGFWVGALLVGLVLAAAPVAWRARSREAHLPQRTLGSASEETRPGAAEHGVAAPVTLAPAPAALPLAADLPFGALPPEGLAAPSAALEASLPSSPTESAATKVSSSHRHHGHRRHEARAKPESAREQAKVSAPASRATPTAAVSGESKLLRSLDF